MPGPCQFTAAAHACQAAATRAADAAGLVHGLAQRIGEDGPETVNVAHSVIADWKANQDGLEFARDFMIAAAMFPDEIQKFMNALNSGKAYVAAERAAIGDTRRLPTPSPISEGGWRGHLRLVRAER